MTSYFAGRELWTPFLSFPSSIESRAFKIPRGSPDLEILPRLSTVVFIAGSEREHARVRCSTITINSHEPREMLISRKISDGLLFFAPRARPRRKTFMPAISRRKCEINLRLYSTGGGSFSSSLFVLVKFRPCIRNICHSLWLPCSLSLSLFFPSFFIYSFYN